MARFFDRKRIFFLILPLGALIMLWIELHGYIKGDPYAFGDVPRAFGNDVFFDLKILTYNLVDCEVPLSSYPADSCTHNLYSFGYPVYPLYLLRNLGLDSSAHIWVGSCMGLITSTLIFLFFIRNMATSLNNKYQLLLATTLSLAFCSGPFRYIVERGQLDQIIIILLLLPQLLTNVTNAGPRTKGIFMLIATCFCLVLGALTKIYPAIALLYISMLLIVYQLPFRLASISRTLKTTKSWSLLPPQNLFFLSLSFSLFFISLAIPIFLREIIGSASSMVPPNVDGHGFGLNVLINAPYATSIPLSLAGKILVFTASLLTTLIAAKKIDFIRHFAYTSFYRLRSADQLFFTTSALLVPLYLLTRSINYKLSLLILILPSLCRGVAFAGGLLKKVYIYALILTLACLLLPMNIPYSPALYVYKEWFIYFFAQPALFGILTGFLIKLPVVHISCR